MADLTTTMHRRILPLIGVLACLVFTTLAQDSESSFTSFKQELMPKVGKTITVEGVLQSAKLGWLVAFNEWGIYLYSTDNKHSPALNSLDRFSGMNVKVTGTLRYFPKPTVPSGEVVY